MFDMKGCKVVRAAQAHELEGLTRAGWTFLGVVQETVVEMANETEHVGVPGNPPSPVNSYGTPAYRMPVNNIRAVPIARAIFLVGLDEASALAALTKERDEAKGALREATEQLASRRRACENARRREPEPITISNGNA